MLKTHAYYNEINPYAAQWLRNLIRAGHIASGDVDERSIIDVRADELSGYSQCHFFAGIAGWSIALRLAGWPDDRAVWTGSCPCQPFARGGEGKGFADPRHLWPIWKKLISERRPPTIFGEQSSKAIEWLGLVRSDLEGLDYAMGAIPIEAASAGAYHFRDRFWFVADTDDCDGDRRNSVMQVGRIAIASQVAPNDNSERIQWPAQSPVPLLAYDVPFRMEQCSAYGNAIVPQVAAEFIAAYRECRP